jgi:hypothetical protein
MQQHTDFVTTRGGAAVSGASVLVKTYPAGATATIYSDDGSTEQDNPITTDADGRFSFYAADGRYTLVISKSGVITQTTLTDAVHLWDPDDGTAEQDAADVSFTQSGSGAQAGTVQTELRAFVRPEQFGAVGDGATDDTAAINAAHTQALAIDGILSGYPGKTYRVTAALDAWKCDFDFRGCDLSVEDNPTYAVTVGITASVLVNITGHLPRITNADHAAGWSGEGTGVRVINCAGCQIFVPKVQGFAVGVHMDSDSTSGCAYNTIHIGRLTNNKKNLRLWASSSTGFVNQNTFVAGQYHIESSEGSGISGARHLSVEPADVAEAAQNWPNNNVWLNPSLEGNGPEYHVSLAGSYNGIINPRIEATTPKVQLVGHASTAGKTIENYILGGYQINLITYSNSGIVDLFHVYGGRNPLIKVEGDGVKMANGTSNANPVIIISGGADDLEQKANSGTTDWLVKVAGTAIRGKAATTHAEESARLEFSTGRLYLGPGSTIAIDDYFDWGAAGFTLTFGGVTGVVQANSVSADKGNAAATLTPGTSEHTNLWATELTADRAVTLATSTALNGSKFRIVRTAAGAFNLNVGTGPLKALGIGEWCDVEYNGSAWMLTAYGAL